VIDLRDPTEQWSKHVAIADGLSPGVHHVELRVVSGQVVVDGIVADNDSPRNAVLVQIVGSVIGASTFVVTIFRRPAGAICFKADSVVST
jgi:hypothetical protein